MNRIDRKFTPTGQEKHASSHTRSHGESSLTPFERHILEMMAIGMRRSEIAQQLQRSPQTISNLLTTAKDKLGARTLAEAAALVSEIKQEA